MKWNKINKNYSNSGRWIRTIEIFQIILEPSLSGRKAFQIEIINRFKEFLQRI